QCRVEHTIEALNEKYKQGYKLDIDFVAQKKPKDTHCGQKHLRLIILIETIIENMFGQPAGVYQHE
ncbi:MAG: hypothetical protein QGH27_04405, partial [SAR324 cluster bacterium]|nr:hypothetical protein [SAR324 cluster bacterium]